MVQGSKQASTAGAVVANGTASTTVSKPDIPECSIFALYIAIA